MNVLQEYIPLISTRNVGLLKEMNDTAVLHLKVTFVILSASTLYAQENSRTPRVKREWQEEGENDIYTVCMALGVYLHTGIVMIIYNIDLLGSFLNEETLLVEMQE